MGGKGQLWMRRLGLRLLLLLLLGIRAAKGKTAWGTRLDETAGSGLWDEILSGSVVLQGLGRKSRKDGSGREAICGIRASEGTTDGRSGTETWWSLRGLTRSIHFYFVQEKVVSLRWVNTFDAPLIPFFVIMQPPALLSNYEVLHLLKHLEADHIARTRTAQRLKKEEDDAAAATGHPVLPSPDPPLSVSENLRTIEVEYLTADYQPTRVQTAEGIERLTKSLAPYGLTKAEKLQIVNLTPVEPVELYVIVEELEDRLGNCMEEVLGLVRSSLAAPPPTSSDAPRPLLEIVDETPAGTLDDPDADAPLWEHDATEMEYVDAGEGLGIEGDLDVEDD